MVFRLSMILYIFGCWLFAESEKTPLSNVAYYLSSLMQNSLTCSRSYVLHVLAITDSIWSAFDSSHCYEHSETKCCLANCQFSLFQCVICLSVWSYFERWIKRVWSPHAECGHSQVGHLCLLTDICSHGSKNIHLQAQRQLVCWDSWYITHIQHSIVTLVHSYCIVNWLWGYNAPHFLAGWFNWV